MNVRACCLCAILAAPFHFGQTVCAQQPAQSPFIDIPSSHPAFGAVNELAKQGLVVGYVDGTFRADRPMSRYEVAAALTRLLQEPLRRDPPISVWPSMPILGPVPKDVPESHWAADCVVQLRGWGMISGYPDATFHGARPISRGEFTLILARLQQFVNGLWDLQRGRHQKAAPRLLSLHAAALAGIAAPLYPRKALSRGDFALLLHAFLRRVEQVAGKRSGGSAAESAGKGR